MSLYDLSILRHIFESTKEFLKPAEGLKVCQFRAVSIGQSEAISQRYTGKFQYCQTFDHVRSSFTLHSSFVNSIYWADKNKKISRNKMQMAINSVLGG
jgi:hypothetical protein